MFDHHRSWSESDDYRTAAQAAGVVELPGGLEPEGQGVMEAPCPPVGDPGPAARRVLGEVLIRRWADDSPGEVGK